MNREMSDRIMTAKAYQKKAILALFPEEMGGHLEVIEKELKLMAGEVLRAMLHDICMHGGPGQKYYGADEYEDNSMGNKNGRSGTTGDAGRGKGKDTVGSEGGRNGEGEGVNPEVRTVRNTRKIEIV